MPPGCSYPRAARLRLQRDFRAVLDHGEAVPGRQCLVRRLARAQGPARLGIATPRGFGGAVARNRFRRLVREAFRVLAPSLGALDLMVSPRRGLREATLAGIRADLERAVRRSERPPPPPRREPPAP